MLPQCGLSVVGVGQQAIVGLIVYRLGRHPFKVQRRVRLPLGLSGRLGGDEKRRMWVRDVGVGLGSGGVAQFG